MHSPSADEFNTVEDLIDNAYTFEVSRFPDVPMNTKDRLIYADDNTGHSLIARAPLEFPDECIPVARQDRYCFTL